jgi:hypothetical protein
MGTLVILLMNKDCLEIMKHEQLYHLDEIIKQRAKVVQMWVDYWKEFSTWET